MDISSIQPVLDWLQQNPALAGFIIFLVAAAESLALVGIVIPGIVIMLGVGTLVGLNALGLWSTLAWATLGAITGDWISYWLGRHFDRQLRHIWPLSRYPKLIPKGERFFKRHGGQSVLFGRFVGPLRPIIPAVAGIMHMPQGKFYFINVVSAVLWAPVVILPGVAFGESLQLASEVAWRLVTVIAVVVVLAGLAGYIAKQIFSYALAITVDTWVDYFDMRKAKENIVSLGFIAALVLSISWFVNTYDIKYRPLATKVQVTDFEWWQNNWQSFFLIHTRYDNRYPVTYQWWGKLEDIQQRISVAGWQPAPRFTVKNSLNYFLPNAAYNKLPVMTDQLFNHKEVLLMVKGDKSGGQYLVLRLWSANPMVNRSVAQLWLGSVQSVNVFSPLDMMSLPLPQHDYSRSLTKFRQSLANAGDSLKVNMAFYRNLGISASWRGEVLLLHFDNIPASDAGNSKTVMSQQLAGKSGLMLQAPGPLTTRFEKNGTITGDTLLQAGSYMYRHNGVQLTVGYERNKGPANALSQWHHQIQQRLRQPQGLQLQTLTIHDINNGHIEGVEYRAQYLMPPFGKKVVYRIQALQQYEQRWTITASYKDCDRTGEQLVNAMLSSVTLPTSP
ncbi:MAG: VTT domain-containing protein [Gammaproteobacteria bacterium]